MASQQDLERRVEELEREAKRLRGPRARSIRYRSSASLANIPLLSIALGPDLEKGEWRGHARGIIAIGDVATGVIAFGGLALEASRSAALPRPRELRGTGDRDPDRHRRGASGGVAVEVGAVGSIAWEAEPLESTRAEVARSNAT